VPTSGGAPDGGYVDVHAHILPGIDDGPTDLEQSLAMARAAVASGISTIAATPHLRSDFPAVRIDEVADRCRDLSAALHSEQIPLRIMPGAEVSLEWAVEANDDLLRLASYRQRGTDLLIEAPLAPAVGLERFLYLLRSKGYRVTLAHPERSLQFQRDDAGLRALVDQGVLIQLNADSLLSPGGHRGTKRLARRLLIDGFAHVIASDGHRGASWRPVTRLEAAVAAAAELVGRERAQWMAGAAPATILAGGELPEPPPITSGRRAGLFRRR
jgi:protein-tyrosine phosphatase